MSASEFVVDLQDVVVAEPALADNDDAVLNDDEENPDRQENATTVPLPEALPISKMRKGISRATTILLLPWTLSTLLAIGIVIVNICLPQHIVISTRNGRQTAEFPPAIFNAGFWCGIPGIFLSFGMSIYYCFVRKGLKKNAMLMLYTNVFHRMGLSLIILNAVMVVVSLTSFPLFHAATTRYVNRTFSATQRNIFTALQRLMTAMSGTFAAVAITLCIFKIASFHAFRNCQAELRSLNCDWNRENPPPPSYDEALRTTQPMDVSEQSSLEAVYPAQFQQVSTPAMAIPPPYHAQINSTSELTDDLPTYRQAVRDAENPIHRLGPNVLATNV